MSSAFPSSRVKQHLSKEHNSGVIVFISICCFIGGLLLFLGSEEFYKLKTLIIRHCQVKSIDLKYERQSYFPRWNVTIIYENETKNDFLIGSIGTRSDKWAWTKARKYKINETYPCYHSRNQTSVIQWGWQWNKPEKLKIYAFLFFGVTLITIATVFIILRRCFKAQFRNTQQQECHQLITLLRREDQQQATPSPQSSSSIYNKAV